MANDTSRLKSRALVDVTRLVSKRVACQQAFSMLKLFLEQYQPGWLQSRCQSHDRWSSHETTREPLREHESHTIYRQQPREQRVAGISRRL